MNTPGQRIRQKRKECGYKNQGAFAKLVGCSQSTLSEIESGETQLPSAKVLARMCQLLGVTSRWIIYGEAGEVSIPSPQEEQLLQSFRDLSEESQASILALLKSLKK